MITETLVARTGTTMIREEKSRGELVSVIMPAYNLEHIIPLSILRVREILEKHGYNYEIIVIDDGSKDNTYQEALRVSRVDPERIKVYKLPRNKGKGYALIYGYKHSRGDIIVFFDADLDIDPNQIPLLIETLRSNGSDTVVTSKWHPRSRTKARLTRWFLSRAFYALAKLFLGINLRDTQTGAKAFKRYVLDNVVRELLVKRYAFDLELLTLASNYGFNISEVPALYEIKLNGRFKVREIIRMLIDLLAIAYRHRLRRLFER